MKSLSSVIKASQYSAPKQDVSSAFLIRKSSTEIKCKSVLDEAFEKAEQIVESAQNYSEEQRKACDVRTETELREAKKQGYQDGFARGREEGLQDGKQSGLRQGMSEGARKAEADNQKRLDELAEMIRSVESAKEEILNQFQSDLKDLAMTIAQAVVRRELKTEEGTMDTIIRSALDSYRNQEWVKISVSEHTAELLTKADSSLIQALKSVSDHIRVAAVSGADDGSCVIEMPDQVIDAGIDSQFQKIQSALQEAQTP